MKADPLFWQVFFAALQVAVAAGMGIYVWHRDRSTARKQDLDEVKEAVVCIGTRVTVLESNSITHKDLGDVYDRINTVSDQVSKMDGKMDALVGAVEMIQELLIKNGGKK